MRPRKYFWATMLVAFCDQLFGNSTPRCSNAGFSGSPMTASRISHSIASKGLTPGSVKRLPTLSSITCCGDGWGGGVTAVGHDLSSCERLCGTSPGGKDRYCSSTRTDRNRRRAPADRPPEGGPPCSGGRPPRARRGRRGCGRRTRTGWPRPGRAAASPRSARSPIWLASTSGPLRLTAAAIESDSCFQLLRAHGPLVGRPLEPSQELLDVESLAAAVALRDGHVRLRALVGGEAVAAARAFATAADGVARLGQPRVDHAGRLRGAERATHTGNSTTCSA